MELLKTKDKDIFPTHIDLMWPTLLALKALGGSGNTEEIIDKIVEMQKYPEDIQNAPHTRGNFTKLEYRMTWTRSYLKKQELWKIALAGFGQLLKLVRIYSNLRLKI